MNPACRSRIHRVVFSLALPCFLAAACAPAGDGIWRTGTRIYGECGVTTLIGGQVYKKARHTLPCRGVADEFPGAKEPRLMLHCSTETPLTLLLQTGKAQFHPDPLIRVRYRFNQRATVEKNWFWVQEEHGVGTHSPVIIEDFLRGMAARERLTFEVGDRWATIPFTGDTTGAINDFRSRCAALKK